MYHDDSQRLAVMSIGFLLQNKDDAVVWRGPKKNGEHLIQGAEQADSPGMHCRPGLGLQNECPLVKMRG